MIKQTATKILSLLAALLLAGVAQAAPVADPIAQIRTLHLTYAIYLGGVHIMDSSTDFSHNGPAYNIAMQAGTQGFTKSLFPWTANLNSDGKLQSDAIHPRQTSIATQWKKKPERVDFEYVPGDIKTAFTPPPKKIKKEPVPQELRDGALDPLNGVLQLMTSLAYGKGCQQLVPIYDGHRRFDVSMKEHGQETLDGEDYSIFSGPAQKCALEFTMRAGPKKDREDSHFWEGKDGKEGRDPIYVYLGRVKDGLPPLPVRAETETPFGAVLIHLTGVDDGTKKAAATTP